MVRKRPTHIAAWQAGLAPSCVYVTTYPSEAALPSAAWLRTRIRKLHEHFPFLTATFEDEGMLHEVQEEDIDYDWLIQERAVDDAREDAQKVRREAGATDEDSPDDSHWIMEGEMIRWRRVFGTGKPMWQVTRYLSSGGGGVSTSDGGEQKAYLVFTIAHIIADGVGCLNAALALLESDEKLDQRPKEDFFAVDRDPNYTPKDTSTLKRFDQPATPASAPEDGKTFEPQAVPDEDAPKALPSWPQIALPLEREARTLPFMYCHDSLSLDVLQALKTASKAHGVPTVTPVMFIGMLYVLGSVYGPPFLTSDSADQLSITGMVAACDRDNLEGTSHIFGGLLTSFERALDYPPDPSSSVWEAVRPVSQEIRSPAAWAERRAARASKFSLPRETLMDPQHLLEAYGGLHPPWWGTSYSTLGNIQLPPGSVDFDWTASHPPVQYQSMCVFTVGHEKGTKVHLAWAEGAVEDTTRQREVMRRWKEIMARLAAGAETWQELQQL